MGLPEPSVSNTALVTGASSGIGASIAAEFASRGYSLVLVARREERLRSLATELSSDHSVDAEIITADLGDEGDRDRLQEELRSRGRAVEVLVNNAGFGHQADFAPSPRDRMVEMVRVNVEAVVDLTSRFIGPMVERGRGSVINIASTAAFQPLPGSAVYAASKSFVLSFSEALRTELRGSGVTVTAVCPGPVRTEFTEVAGVGGVEERTPGAVWMSAEEIARHAVDGAKHDKRVVVPGTLNRVTALAGQHSPRAVALPLISRVWRNI
ncbi:MAG TPA: SDR family oxidoreductase [Solirubrobacterales bacterium]|nr:SDR family oxidoreductase [Solirubrobacterales bacterium]